MTVAKIQLNRKSVNFEYGYDKGKEKLLRCREEKNRRFYVYNNHFCVIFKSKVIYPKQAAEEVEGSFKYEN